MVLQVNPIQKEPIVTWEALPADFILPDDPLENIQQPAIAAALKDSPSSNLRNLGPLRTKHRSTVLAKWTIYFAASRYEWTLLDS